MSDEPTIEVEIMAFQRVTYVQRKAIPVSRFEEYQAMLAEEGYHDSDFAERFGDLIDLRDVCDGDDFEDMQITPLAKGDTL